MSRKAQKTEKKISISVPVAEHRAMKERVARDGCKGFQTIGLNLFRRWMSGEFEPEKPFGEVSERERRYVELLLSLLREAHEPDWVLANLDVWERLREERSRKASN